MQPANMQVIIEKYHFITDGISAGWAELDT